MLFHPNLFIIIIILFHKVLQSMSTVMTMLYLQAGCIIIKLMVCLDIGLETDVVMIELHSYFIL